VNEPAKVKIITPDMSTEPTWLEDVISAKVPVLVFRGFLLPAINLRLVSDLKRCAEWVRVSTYLNATLTTLGPYLAKYASCPDEYFRQASVIQPLLPQSLVSMRCNIYQLVKQWLQLKSLKTAVEPVWGEYAGSVVRFHANGIANPLHNDNISRDAVGTELVVSKIVQQLSCVVCLQECTSGGVLRVFKKKWRVEDERFKFKCELGYSGGVVEGYGFYEFSPQVGDVYIFNPNFYHEIDRVCGATRVTLGFFFGLTDQCTRQAIAWS